MAIPTYDHFIEPLLRLLARQPEGLPARVAHEQAADALGIPAPERQELVPSGAQPIYKNRAGWAHDRLKRAGLSSSPRRGYWKITEKGLELMREHPVQIPAAVKERIATEFLDIKLKGQSAAIPVGPDSATPESSPTGAYVSPDERLWQAVRELRQTAETELLELLGAVSPTFFETIVLDLLHRMGYGASRADLQRVGGSGDGGIDGVISLDRLGLEKVYVQAKRWQDNVGRPALQAFYGALAGQKAKKGVFITTSGFTAQAQDFARSVEGIVLIDGSRLASLMVDYELGVSARVVKIPKIDSDYFDEEVN
ncbi:MAG: restriction endonuclease [Xanthomonadales bacterium]|jgi:restriction system protein|nr:restriction endonuclease [Xanthomonadales bacterium]